MISNNTTSEKEEKRNLSDKRVDIARRTKDLLLASAWLDSHCWSTNKPCPYDSSTQIYKYTNDEKHKQQINEK